VDVDTLLSGLDADQREAVTVPGGPLAIIAAPGSGKTTVLTRRIAYRVATDADVHAQHVLALTFTSQAATELQRRLRRVGMRDRVQAGTFHAVALRLLRQRAADTDQTRVALAGDRIRLLNEALKSAPSLVGLDAHAVMGEIDWSRASLDSASVPAKKGALPPVRTRRTGARRARSATSSPTRAVRRSASA